MKKYQAYFFKFTRLFAGLMLASMFLIFLLQIFSRYVLREPIGWTVELSSVLWLWIVFFGNAFVVRERDHVKFDVVYNAASPRVQRVFSLIALGFVVAGLLWAFLPTWDYVDWVMRKPSPTLPTKMGIIYSIYIVFMVAVIWRYGWRFVRLLMNLPAIEEDNEEEEGVK